MMSHAKAIKSFQKYLKPFHNYFFTRVETGVYCLGFSDTLLYTSDGTLFHIEFKKVGDTLNLQQDCFRGNIQGLGHSYLVTEYNEFRGSYTFQVYVPRGKNKSQWGKVIWDSEDNSLFELGFLLCLDQLP